ncbi:MAG: hypothetical protein ACERKK_01550 [Poseidonibacter sp.]|uniref:hypothetical protein n=1 Tax=Poseidonibacter sp. TaxID=2321188 RepID=UPI00359CBB91
MKNYIVFDDGEIVLVNDFNKVFPMTMVKNDTYRIEICGHIIEKYYKLEPNSLEWKIFINILSLRSIKIEIITALVLLSKTKKIRIINTDFIDNSFSKLFDYDIEIINENFKISYIDKAQFRNAVIKFFINNFFRLFINKKIPKTSSVIRAWTEHDLHLHKEVVDHSSIFIYPFGINLRRSIHFIKRCYKENSNVTFMGVPYSFIKLLKIFLSTKKQKDLSLLEYEVSAMKKHSKEFLGFNTIYTSDEFLPAVPALYNELIKENKHVHNVAHGMGMLNPYNIYTKFQVINEIQKNFYEQYDKKIEYSTYMKDFYTERKEKSELQNAYVFIHQNLATYGLLYESQLQNQILSLFNTVDTNNVFIKFHPNCLKEEKDTLLSKYNNIKEIKEFNTNRNNYRFFATCSSAYYDFRKFGKFIFIEDDLFNPLNFFTNITILHINQLKNYLINNKGI